MKFLICARVLALLERCWVDRAPKRAQDESNEQLHQIGGSQFSLEDASRAGEL